MIYDFDRPYRIVAVDRNLPRHLLHQWQIQSYQNHQIQMARYKVKEWSHQVATRQDHQY